MTPEEFKKALEDKGYQISDHQMAQFATYYKTLVETNEHVNLTAITEENEVYLKHFYDSVTPLLEAPEYFKSGAELCDVGAGAGFPSLPMKILFPSLKVTIVDSLNKRITFLKTLVDQLELTDVTLVHDRAETFGAKKSVYREKFEIVTARAVARLSVLSELCIPLVKQNGFFIALKAANTEQELSDGKMAIAILGGKLIVDKDFALPATGDERHLVVVEKKKQTPNKYPRKPGTPGKDPIGKK
ncbi:16S rRNA (guanine(527)-N(7))-methyltransferase RsmG [Pediococcus pentosaceus]|jgi:16S rRNA (guanine527-N7)-methyltransferase|uniref:16S rRNA (guanine(527)-N(7))-methyltransferase RsmG n=1 Tax=Pediococcus pentosaceus TaxID=1255 RepID=UPI0006D8CAFD|nr:16S rRNA (guanine(527)-N(7))-methyltransferase RsmG [Pediococcus pentosaceus]ANI97263.1 16S rRNA (guanine(527)-N(7))-methyltransferase [Pediococcus pentosaceus]ASC07748.1 16S rRNA (guanine(527)-N(7))-methyltransferase [Pediococcus pentosaceus]KQB80030.1 16S rRNA (guanine(527)-N(7))-methyltransferase RsmG [Pediococcus pentosaceus]MBF7113019.1 16S rRNA (guanine(527)-N(7))-methyltransferase RsmG [Pediococcus pentosaceus]MBY4581803.1 16S rRNA (guanine(527)-N(7))-methyltransferase RsmG [Pediococ